VTEPSDLTFCNGQLTSEIDLNTVTTGNVSFTWENDNPSIGLDPTGSGNIPVFTTSNSTDSPVVATITVTPHFEDGSLICDGDPITFTITVNPTPQVVPVAAETTLCNEGTTSIRLTSPSSFSNGDIRFRYEAVSTGGVTGFDSSEEDLEEDFVIEDELYNPTDEPQTVTYTIYPVDPTGLCSEGPSVEVEIVVNPTPRIFPLPEEEYIRCNEFPVNITLNSPTIFSGGSLVTINLSATAPEGVEGFAESLTDLANGYVVNDILVNTTDSPLTVEYTVVPVSPHGCANGQEVRFRVKVNPTPRATPVNVKPAICYSDETLITLASPTEMTSGTILFDYTVLVPANVTGDPGPGNNLEEGDDLSFELSNNDDAVQSVYFYITPKVAGLDCPAGDPVTVEVQVHPIPARDIVVTKPFTCESSAGRASLRADISRGAEPYEVLWSGPLGYKMSGSLEITDLYAGTYTVYVEDNIGCSHRLSEIIYNMSATPIITPWPVLPDIHVSCPGGNDGTARFFVRTGITEPYNYRIYRNETELVGEGTFSGNYVNSIPTTYVTPDNLRAGSYKLVVTDNNGCETYKTADLFEPEPISISFEVRNYNESNISCRGYSDGYITATVTGGNGSYSYNWSAASGPLSVNSTSNVLDGVPAGTYYLTVTDLLGCPMTESVTLTDPPGMILSGSEVSHSRDNAFNISCNGASDGYINLEITGGSGNYTYLWVGPGDFTATTRDISNLKAGIYTCTVTDINGCILMPHPEFELREPASLAVVPARSISADGNYNISCAGGTGSVDITVTGGSSAGYSYSWSTTDGSGIIAGQEDQNALRAGNYNLKVTDFNGCISSVDFSMTEPEELTSELIPGHITCQESGFNDGSMNLTVTGGVAPYSYLWSNGEMTQDITNLTEGFYTVTVTDANGCQSTATERINLPPPLSYEKSVSEFNGFNISCYGRADGFISITPESGTPPYIFSWEGPDGFTSDAASISGLRGGVYILSITDLNYCTATETIELREPGKTGMTVTIEDIICAGEKTGSIAVEAVNNAGPVDYLWADGEMGKARSGLMAGEYKLIITDSNGCSADSVITLTEPDSINLSFMVTQPLCTDLPNGKIDLSVTGGSGQGYTYLWSDGTTSQDLGTAVSGLYSVTVTDESGCMVTGSVMVNPLNELCLDIPNAISPNGDLRNDVWNIGLRDLYPDMEVKIFNRWGDLIWKSERGYPVPWDGRSRGEILPIDSYHYIIDLNNGTRPLLGHITIVK
jgi:gliding motility-associated-like protein